MLKRAGSLVFKVLKWVFVAAVSIEALCFIAITLSNLVIYGHAWEGSRSAYDSHAIFHQQPTPRATSFNAVSPRADHNRIIWMLGGSTTRNSDADDDTTIASLVAQRLNQQGSPLYFTVRNYGQNSYNSLLEVQLLQEFLIRQSPPPSLIVMYDGANEAAYLGQYRTVDGHYGYRRLRALITGYRNNPLGIFKAFNAFWYASATRELYDKLHQVALPLTKGSALVKDYVDLLERRYQYIDRIARAHGARLVVCWQPTAWTEAKGAAKAVRGREDLLADRTGLGVFQGNMRVVYSAVLTRLASKPYFIDLSKVLEQRTEPAYRSDGVHLMEAGRRMADGLMPFFAKPRQEDPAR